MEVNVGPQLRLEQIECRYHACSTREIPFAVAWSCEAAHREFIWYCAAHIGLARAMAVQGLLEGAGPCCERCPGLPVMRPDV
jgi:hypothetical protein